jgi:predicted DNA-binding transcriptional regulator AlpA
VTRKADVARPYAPDFCDAATLAYRLDISRDDVAQRVKQGLLPPPLSIIPGKHHWRWADVEAWILARNGRAAGQEATPPATTSGADPAFVEGLARAKASHASN